MDSSRKPVLKNPRKGANPISQLLFLWIIPTMFRVSHAVSASLLHTSSLSKALSSSSTLTEALININKIFSSHHQRNIWRKMKYALQDL
ncbi:CLUMA_CG012730, isoform A [Clunio marinus]|uniref:CLUMA_CG012730, isoform A n=1 Tax=Clunio marinus TaxID=568069 RepID=A0A1J1IIE6_9DIPT|nr:CLUMA_CG012730, isoform A [Clunio marinus]